MAALPTQSELAPEERVPCAKDAFAGTSGAAQRAAKAASEGMALGGAPSKRAADRGGTSVLSVTADSRRSCHP